MSQVRQPGYDRLSGFAGNGDRGPDRDAGWTAIIIAVLGGVIGFVITAYVVVSHIGDGM